MFLDATYIPLRRGTVEREAVNVAIGIRSDGGKVVLDYSIAPTENGAAWSELLQGLRARGIKDIQLFIVDGLVGLQSAIEANYPQAKFQRCWGPRRAQPFRIRSQKRSQGDYHRL